MATIAVQTVVRTGLEAAYVAVAGGGDKFLNDGKTMIHIKNANGADRTLTIVSQATVDDLAVADRTVVITAGEERFIGPFPKSTYNDVDGFVQLTYSAAADVTIAALKM